MRFKIEKLKLLTHQDIEDLGWEKRTGVKFDANRHIARDWFQWKNYFLIPHALDDGTPIIDILAIDPSIINWIHNPERFRVVLKCPTKDHLELIMTML